MASQSEQLEREAEDARRRLQATIEELRSRMTLGAIFDQMIELARRGPPAEFFRNVAREARENPVPLILVGIGIAWLGLSAGRLSRAVTADLALRKAARTDKASAVVVGIDETAAVIAIRAPDPAGVLAEQAQQTATLAADVIGNEEWPLTGVAEGRRVPPAPPRDNGQRTPVVDEG